MTLAAALCATKMKESVIQMKRLTCLLIAICLVLSFGGCTTQEEKKEYNVPALFQSILSQVQFDDTLENVGSAAALYFADMPENARIELYMGSGYFADEAALITLAGASDMKAAKASVEKHLAQIHDQFAHYIPEELDKISRAVVWEYDKYIILCITDNAQDVKTILDNGYDPNFKLPENTTPSTNPTEPSTPTEPTNPTNPTTPTNPTEPTKPTDPKPTEPKPTEPNPTFPPDLPVNPVNKYRPDGYPYLKSVLGTYSFYSSGLMRVDNRAIELWGYNDRSMTNYANLVSKVADALAGTTTVYSLPIPTCYGIMMPDDIQAIIGYADQGQGIESLLKKMSSNVVPIRCFDNLMSHRNEYLYFRTDHHWNGIGAYYAYEAFCETKGVNPYTMAQRQLMKFENFQGYLYKASGYDQTLLPGDTVYAYLPYYSNSTMVYYDNNGNAHSWPIVVDATNWNAGSKYSAFAAGDQPLAKLTNPNITDGSVCIVVKESFGNALMPYMVDHYSTVYEVDYRYWKGDLVSFAREVGATDLIFANNMQMVTADALVARLATIIK